MWIRRRKLTHDVISKKQIHEAGAATSTNLSRGVTMLCGRLQHVHVRMCENQKYRGKIWYNYTIMGWEKKQPKE